MAPNDTYHQGFRLAFSCRCDDHELIAAIRGSIGAVVGGLGDSQIKGEM